MVLLWVLLLINLYCRNLWCSWHGQGLGFGLWLGWGGWQVAQGQPLGFPEALVRLSQGRAGGFGGDSGWLGRLRLWNCRFWR